MDNFLFCDNFKNKDFKTVDEFFKQKNDKNSFLINGKKKLYGEIKVDSAKNAILPILASCILCEGVVKLYNITYYDDVINMLDILQSLGANIKIFDDALIIDCAHLDKTFISLEQTNKLRASIFCLGPLLARHKKARLAYPGGCAIGSRPIDIHLIGLKKMGAEILDRHGYITAKAENLKAEKLYLPFPSVGATENLIMASVLTKGITTIYGCAKEPEVEDLCNFLNSMGAHINNYGDTIEIEGVKALYGCEYSLMPDRILAGTLLMAPLICGGEVILNNVKSKHITPLIDMLKNNNCKLYIKGDRIKILASKRLKSFGKIETMPYPHFPTDLQQPLCALACFTKGTTVIIENLFENRFKHISSLVKMGADIVLSDRSAVVNGVQSLYGAEVEAEDLRGGASLVLAGLGAEGYTTVKNINYIDRGYYKFEEKLSLIGADIKRI